MILRQIAARECACYHSDMQDRIEFRPASSVPTQRFVEALNEAYRDYYRPLHMTAASFEMMIEREAVVPEASVVALDRDHRVVGVALLGARPPQGWIGGVGVIGTYRRQGIARAMMRILLDEAQSRALETIQLEVITLNEGARALYESLGFEPKRKLLLLQRQPARPRRITENGSLKCRACPSSEVLNRLDALDGVKRAWSRDATSLRPLADMLEGYLALDADTAEVFGACLYSSFPFQVGILTLAGMRQAGKALLHRLHAEHPDSTISYFNVPDEDPMVPELMQAGYQETLAQFEMILTLNT